MKITSIISFFDYLLLLPHCLFLSAVMNIYVAVGELELHENSWKKNPNNFCSLQSDNLSGLVHCKALGVAVSVQEKEQRYKKLSLKINPSCQINKLGLV